MEYVIIGACIVVAIAGGIVLYVKNKRTKNELGNTAVVVSKTSSSKLQASEVANDPVIQIGILPADAISDETKLVEITDSKVLAHINNLVPGLAQAGNAANNATQAVKANGEVLYRAIIPAGAKLTDSKAMEGAVRGFYHGADGIRGHANLVAVEAQKGTAVAANTAAAAMGVASMIVGQYYMTQINAELGVISDGISQIQNFQDNEYRSRVFSLVAHVKKIADFQTEILENDELRLSKITTDGFREYRMSLENEKFDKLIACVESLNNVISNDESLGDGFCIGHSYFCNLLPDTIDDQVLSGIVEYELIPLLKEYWFDEPTKVKDWSSNLRSAIK